jgi:DNA-binding transcriptional ArsR family regulator
MKMNKTEIKKLRGIVEAVRKTGAKPLRGAVIDTEPDEIKVPVKFLRSKEYSHSMKTVFQLLKGYAAEKGRKRDENGNPILPPQKEMAREAGISRATLQRALDKLVQAGLLNVRRQGLAQKGESQNVYILAPFFYEIGGFKE